MNGVIMRPSGCVGVMVLWACAGVLRPSVGVELVGEQSAACSRKGPQLICNYKERTQVAKLERVSPWVELVYVYNTHELHVSRDVCVDLMVDHVEALEVVGVSDPHLLNCSSKQEILATYSTLTQLPNQVDWVQLENCTVEYLVAAAALRHLKVINSQVKVVEVALAPDTTAELHYSQLQQVKQLLVPDNSSLLLNNTKLSGHVEVDGFMVWHGNCTNSDMDAEEGVVLLKAGGRLKLRRFCGNLDIETTTTLTAPQPINLKAAHTSRPTPTTTDADDTTQNSYKDAFIVVLILLIVLLLLMAAAAIYYGLRHRKRSRTDASLNDTPDSAAPLLHQPQGELNCTLQTLRSVVQTFETNILNIGEVPCQHKQEINQLTSAYDEEKYKIIQDSNDKICEVEKNTKEMSDTDADKNGGSGEIQAEGSEKKQKPSNDDDCLNSEQLVDLIMAKKDLIQTEFERDKSALKFRFKKEMLNVRTLKYEAGEERLQQLNQECFTTLLQWKSKFQETESSHPSANSLVAIVHSLINHKLNCTSEKYQQLSQQQKEDRRKSLEGGKVILETEEKDLNTQFEKDCSEMEEDKVSEISELESREAEKLGYEILDNEAAATKHKNSRETITEKYQVRRKAVYTDWEMRLTELREKYSTAIELRHVEEVTRLQQEQEAAVQQVVSQLIEAQKSYILLLSDSGRTAADTNRSNSSTRRDPDQNSSQHSGAETNTRV